MSANDDLGDDNECTGAGNCHERLHAPHCLSRTLTDAELQNGVVPPDDELRLRAELLWGAA